MTIEKKELRQFGLMMATALSLLNLFLFWRKGEIFVLIIFFSVLFLLLSFVGTSILKPLYKIWMAFSLIMGKCITTLILAILFYLIFTPMGLVIKLLRKDLLGLKFNQEKDSYWFKKSQSQPSSYEKQF